MKAMHLTISKHNERKPKTLVFIPSFWPEHAIMVYMEKSRNTELSRIK